MSSSNPLSTFLSRRHFLQECRYGLGKIALASLLSNPIQGIAKAAATRGADSSNLTARPPHFAPRAKAVIHLFMGGGPSQLDLFDYKPKLTKYEGKSFPPEVIGGQRYAFIRPDAAALGPRFKFAKHGECGAELSEVLPHLAEVVDDICIIRSVHTDQFNHAPAELFFTTGFSQPGRPSIGSWATYGLGAETSELPAYVVLSTGEGPAAGPPLWGSGFLPAEFDGVLLRNQGDPVLHVTNPAGVDARLQRDTLDLLGTLNRERQQISGDPRITARIASYEMAYRMQTSAPELTDLRSETQATLDLYGVDPQKPSFARACLLARRMVERGVRFINVYHCGWDAHNDVAGNSRERCGQTDQGSAALVADLKARGLLDETLVVWGGEFGRTPMIETNATLGRSHGRDHHPQACTIWMAGGGIKPGTTYGKTDDLGFHIVENPVHIHDVQATMLHSLGLDHERLTYRHAGRDFRLTDVSGKVIREVLA